MRLTEINTDNLSDKQIEQIVFQDIHDDKKNSEIAIVFGNHLLQGQRVESVIRLYKEKRVKKIMFLGGTGGISNQSNETKSEAECMKEIAMSLGIPEDDIILEDKSNNSIENCINVLTMLNDIYGFDNIQRLTLVSSEFHLKRCLAVFMKYCPKKLEYTLVPAKDGFSDKDNWFNSDNSWNSGRSLVTFEAKALVKYANEDKIYNLDIPNFVQSMRR